MESEDHLLMEEINMIIITYLFLLRPGEHTVSKSESTIFHLKYTAYSCGLIVFEATNTEFKLQATNFVMPTFTTQKNGIRGYKIGHNASGDPLLCPNADLFWRVIQVHGVTASTPLSLVMTPAERLNSVFVASKTMRPQL